MNKSFEKLQRLLGIPSISASRSKKDYIDFFKSKKKKKIFTSKQQHDCLEVISIIASTLNKKFSNFDKNLIDEIFYGKLGVEYICLNLDCVILHF